MTERRPIQRPLIIDISRIMDLPKLLILIIALRGEVLGPGDRSKRAIALLKHLQLGCSHRLRLVDAVHLDAMGTGRDMKAPVPGRSDSQRLSIQRVVPSATDNFDPALDVAREVHLPDTPGELVLLGHVLGRYGIPTEAAIGAQLHLL